MNFLQHLMGGLGFSAQQQAHSDFKARREEFLQSEYQLIVEKKSTLSSMKRRKVVAAVRELMIEAHAVCWPERGDACEACLSMWHDHGVVPPRRR